MFAINKDCDIGIIFYSNLYLFIRSTAGYTSALVIEASYEKTLIITGKFI